MTQTNDPPLVASVALIPDSDEKADLDAPSDESGKLVVSQAPNITITSTTVVADQAERLALDPQEGDIAIQQDTTESFIFTGGANELANWQLVQFDAVGGIAGEDIAPRDIDGRNVVVTDIEADTLTAANSLDTPSLTATDVSTNTLSSSTTLTANDVTINGLLNGADTSAGSAGEALTSDGAGGFGFSPVGSAAITRNGNEIEYVSLDTANLPAATDTGDVALVTGANEYVQDREVGAFDITRATLTTQVSSQERAPTGLDFGDSGAILYEVDLFTDKITQLTVSTPFDIATASFDKQINSESGGPNDVLIADNGTKLYEVSNNPDEIFQYSLSTPFDIGTASLVKSKVAQGSSPSGMAIADGGTKIYVSDRSESKIFQSTLSTPFEIDTASFDASITTSDAEPQDVDVVDGGTKLVVLGGGTDTIFQRGLSTPFEITSAGGATSINAEDSQPKGLDFDDNGSNLYEIGSGGGNIYQSNINVSDEWTTI